jgi:hypothetical protein
MTPGLFYASQSPELSNPIYQNHHNFDGDADRGPVYGRGNKMPLSPLLRKDGGKGD